MDSADTHFILISTADTSACAAACTPDNKGITYNEHINVAIAVTMPDGGLITPVIKVTCKTFLLLCCVYIVLSAAGVQRGIRIYAQLPAMYSKLALSGVLC